MLHPTRMVPLPSLDDTARRLTLTLSHNRTKHCQAFYLCFMDLLSYRRPFAPCTLCRQSLTKTDWWSSAEVNWHTENTKRWFPHCSRCLYIYPLMVLADHPELYNFQGLTLSCQAAKLHPSINVSLCVNAKCLIWSVWVVPVCRRAINVYSDQLHLSLTACSLFVVLILFSRTVDVFCHCFAF